MELLEGKQISLKIKENILNELAKIQEKPVLYVLVNENDLSSIGYVKMIEKNCLNLNIGFEKVLLEEDEETYIKKIEELNKEKKCTAIMVTRPLFKGANETKILSHISPLKDVDVMCKEGLGEILLGNDDIAPATSKAIITMLEYYGVDIKGKDCLVIGRSISVGKPTALMLLNRHGTVTIAHSRTTNLEDKIANSDIIICAVGIPNFLDCNLCKDSAVVIDAGIHYLDDGGIVGDVIPSEKVSKLSKVPGGVGTITNSILLENVLKLYKKQRG